LDFSRRNFLGVSIAGVAAAAIRPAFARTQEVVAPITPALLRRARAALQRHGDSIAHRDVMGIADFSLPSKAERFFLLNLNDGSVRSYLVAHGRGSDPAHTGWLERFSNESHSYATSAGAFRTGDTYIGSHGHSLHLTGLDASNCNAAARGIVVHGAWYVSEQIAAERGVLGRSEGCFALASSSLNEVIRVLGPGRLIYADKA
jgi:L,D-transpeptidase catalytic domain